jgi:hypothetical protein
MNIRTGISYLESWIGVLYRVSLTMEFGDAVRMITRPDMQRLADLLFKFSHSAQLLASLA